MSDTIYFVGPWDLNRELPCVPADPAEGVVVLVESVAKGKALPWHRQKLVLVLSAIRHFAAELEEAGYTVDLAQAPSYVEGIRAAAARHGAKRVVALRPREWSLNQALNQDALEELELVLHPAGGEGGHFLLSREEWFGWVGQQRKKSKGKTLRMDTFYRWMRKRLGLLLDAEGKPVGGKWSYDAENRKSIPKDARPPEAPRFEPDEITREVMEQVEGWRERWGSVEGFRWPVTRAQALEVLERFVSERLGEFGDYQDGMRQGDAFLWHSLISSSINLSLLHPREVAEEAIAAYERGEAPLNAVEGFVRQVIGWREFIRGVYWLRMPGMRSANLLDARRPLPRFYWEPERTDMACLRDAAGSVLEHGYAHHIQRLMVLGNFALLAEVEPIQLSHWFWAGFVDAYEWVELPNVHGMALYADDTFTTKPYAASASYVNKMSDYCKGCRYAVSKRTGENACPFNFLFWNFMARHRERLSDNFRLKMLYKTWDRWDDDERDTIRAQAAAFLDELEPADHGWAFEDDAC